MSAGQASAPIKRLSMFDVDSAPESPGLYAWYVHPQVSAPNWGTAEDEDSAAEAFVDALQRYATVYEPPAIDLRGTSAYDARWEGRIHVDFPFGTLENPLQSPTDISHDDAIHASPPDENVGQHLLRVASSGVKRDALTRLLSQAIPIFATPLYIGIATDLKQRLGRHKSDFTRVSDYLRNRPDDRQRAIKQARSFGHRAAARQVAMEDLEVWILDLQPIINSGMNTDDIRDVTRSAEWYMHRLFAPILGRR